MRREELLPRARLAGAACLAQGHEGWSYSATVPARATICKGRNRAKKRAGEHALLVEGYCLRLRPCEPSRTCPGKRSLMSLDLVGGELFAFRLLWDYVIVFLYKRAFENVFFSLLNSIAKLTLNCLVVIKT